MNKVENVRIESRKPHNHHCEKRFVRAEVNGKTAGLVAIASITLPDSVTITHATEQFLTLKDK